MSLTLSSTVGSDYTDPVVRTVTFGPNETSKTYPVPIVDDSNIESTETFTASLSTAESNVNIGDDTATVTILDIDSELFTIWYLWHAMNNSDVWDTAFDYCSHM